MRTRAARSSGMFRVSTTRMYGALPCGYTTAASCRTAVMLPVLWATRVPGGRPAGISSLNSWRLRTVSIASQSALRCRGPSLESLEEHAEVDAATSCCSCPSRNALPSSTPRSTRMSARASAWAVESACVAPTSSISGVGGQIARPHDHALDELSRRHPLTDAQIHGAVGVIDRVDGRRRSVDNGRELIDEQDGLCGRQSAAFHLPEELDHHRHLHRARGMKR